MDGDGWLERWVERDLPLWAGLPADARAELVSSLEPMALLGGGELFVQGEPADALYVLVAGSVGISSRDHAGQTRRIARISPPETIGEMGVISGAPRSATAVALRDSVVLRLSGQAFERLVERWPHAALYVARLLADRLRVRTHGAPLARRSATVAILPVTEGVDAAQFGRALWSRIANLSAGRSALLDAYPAGADETWFHRFEASHDRVVYVAGRSASQWAELCRRRADHLLFLAAPGRPLLDRATCVMTMADDWHKRDLVVLQDEHARTPVPAHSSVASLATDLRLNVRSGHEGDLRRLARTVTGEAVGLVLSGGGARGFAHIGVLLAWREKGYAVDLVGGTSIGAVIGAGLAAGWSIAEIKDRIREAFVVDPPLDDFTLPLVALLRGHKVDGRLARAFGDLRIENLWLPFFCVSSNLTSGRLHLHTSGSLARGLRASIAIPGLLPPVIEPHGVLADGAMMNNLPADIMADLQRGSVVAVDVARDLALRARSRQTMLRRLLRISGESPSITSILLRAATVSSDAQRDAMLARASMVFQPPLASIGLRSWRSFDEAVEIGYTHAAAQLSRMASSDQIYRDGR